ncbi:MAG: hypothetical protein AAGC55_22905, partial [Myxococcota bacterium]
MTGSRIRRGVIALAPPLVVLVAVLIVWELAVYWIQPRKFVFCAPSDIWRDSIANAGELASATWNTTLAVLIGFG